MINSTITCQNWAIQSQPLLFCFTYYKAKLKSNWDKASSCFSPLWIENASDKLIYMNVRPLIHTRFNKHNKFVEYSKFSIVYSGTFLVYFRYLRENVCLYDNHAVCVCIAFKLWTKWPIFTKFYMDFKYHSKTR